MPDPVKRNYASENPIEISGRYRGLEYWVNQESDSRFTQEMERNTDRQISSGLL